TEHLPGSAEPNELPADWREQLREAAYGLPNGPPESFSDAKVASMLQIAASTNQPLDLDTCKSLVKFLLSYEDDDLVDWLHTQWLSDASVVTDELADIAGSLKA